jgi:hypothetical protein
MHQPTSSAASATPAWVACGIVEIAYYPFAREAELQDHGALVPAAAWQTFGKVICALISAGYAPRVLGSEYPFQPGIQNLSAISHSGPRDVALMIEQRLKRLRYEELYRLRPSR